MGDDIVMKRNKKVAVRFEHPTFSAEMAKELEIGNLLFKHPKEPNTFDVIVEEVPQFEGFADKVEKKTGHRPRWVSLYGFDLSDVEGEKVAS